jgi:hypothetical protein
MGSWRSPCFQELSSGGQQQELLRRVAALTGPGLSVALGGLKRGRAIGDRAAGIDGLKSIEDRHYAACMFRAIPPLPLVSQVTSSLQRVNSAH